MASGDIHVSQLGGSAAQIERRRARRYAYDTLLEIEWGSATLSGRVQDVSAEGMFVALTDPLWIGAGFTAVWHLGEAVRVDCVVRRVEPGRGMGVSFSADAAVRERVSALLDRLSAQ
jgi:hypothetical protein